MQLETTQDDIDKNVAKIFGSIDPGHTWNSINQGTVTVTADADLDDIVKVQILTESPFFNEDAKVLNEANATKGQTVILNLGGLDITTFAKRISIIDKTTGSTITFSEKGQDPHSILVPCGFPYPKEKSCITTSYPKFMEWAQDHNKNIDWYLYPSRNNTFYYK